MEDFTITCDSCGNTDVKVFYTNNDDGVHFECQCCGELTTYEGD